MSYKRVTVHPIVEDQVTGVHRSGPACDGWEVPGVAGLCVMRCDTGETHRHWYNVTNVPSGRHVAGYFPAIDKAVRFIMQVKDLLPWTADYGDAQAAIQERKVCRVDIERIADECGAVPLSGIVWAMQIIAREA